MTDDEATSEEPPEQDGVTPPVSSGDSSPLQATRDGGDPAGWAPPAAPSSTADAAWAPNPDPVWAPNPDPVWAPAPDAAWAPAPDAAWAPPTNPMASWPPPTAPTTAANPAPGTWGPPAYTPRYDPYAYASQQAGVAGGGSLPPWQPPTSGDPWASGPMPMPPWQQQPAPARSRGAFGVVFTLVAVLVAAIIGASVGSHLFHQQAATPGTATFPLQPSFGGGTGGGTGGTGGFGGSSSTPASSTPLTSAQQAQVTTVEHGVVDIYTDLGYQEAEAAGTGMVISPSGEVLTNNHVIDGATNIMVTLVDTQKSYKAKVVGEDPTADIAVLQMQGVSGLKTVPTDRSSSVRVGNGVIAIGNAGGAGGTPSVVTGAVTAVNQTITASDENGSNPEQLSNLIQTDAPIQPGDSGGPLVNSSGNVIGMDTVASVNNRFESSATEGFTIPIGTALDLAQKIESGHATSTIQIGIPGFLGVEIEPSGQGGFGGQSSSANGALVAGVTSGSPAAAIGLAAGDTIASIDGQSVTLPTTLKSLLVAHQPGDKVTIAWTDQSGGSHQATATLETGPAD